MNKEITNWGNFPKVDAVEHRFSSVEALKFNLQNMEGSCIARGNGRCYGDASLAGEVISCLSFDHILSFDPVNGEFECESGVTLDQILEVIVPKGWFLPVTPGTKYVSVGGAVASDIHGKNHHIDGSFCDHVTRIALMLSSGEVVTCSPDHNVTLFNVVRGGMGLSGIILRVRFKLKKITTSYIKQVQVKARNLQELLALFQEYKSYTYTMSWIDCLKGGKDFGRSILMAGMHADADELNGKQKEQLLEPRASTLFTFPVDLPAFVLNTYSVKAFNFLYYHKNTKKEIKNLVPYDPFFYPLDKILDWNKGYGRRGFVQYQFVLPMAASKAGMTDILHRIHKKGFGSFLAVFKVFGKQDGLISFPMEGCTLALDFPVRRNLFPFLDELDKVVLDYGGRLYLTKDARMRPEFFWKSYPKAQSFYDGIRQFNIGCRFRSLQSDRLQIT